MLSDHTPITLGNLTQKELDDELIKGLASMKDGKGFSADEVDEEIAKYHRSGLPSRQKDSSLRSE